MTKLERLNKKIAKAKAKLNTILRNKAAKAKNKIMGAKKRFKNHKVNKLRLKVYF